VTRPPNAPRPALRLVCVVGNARAASLRRAWAAHRSGRPESVVRGLDHLDLVTLMPPGPPGAVGVDGLVEAVCGLADRPYVLMVEPAGMGTAVALVHRTGSGNPLVQIVVLGAPVPDHPAPAVPTQVPTVALVSAGCGGPPPTIVEWSRWSTALVVRVVDAGGDPVVNGAREALAIVVEETRLLPSVIPADPSDGAAVGDPGRGVAG
jgi:hypothetical protein